MDKIFKSLEKVFENFREIKVQLFVGVLEVQYIPSNVNICALKSWKLKKKKKEVWMEET